MALIGALLAFLVCSSPASAVQATGALALDLSKQSAISLPHGSNPGEEFELTIRLENGSSDTPAADFPDQAGAAVPAVLSGPVTVLLGCTDVACSTVQRSILFVPRGDRGCVSRHPSVTGCSVGEDGTTVTIDVGAQGIVVPGASTVDVAVIRLRLLAASGSSLGIRATSRADGLQACSSSAPSVCAEVLVQGLTFVTPQAGNQAGGRLRVTIRFRGDLATPDQIDFDAKIRFEGSVNLSTATFAVSLSNSLTDPVFSFALPEGMLSNGKHINRTAKMGGGIAKVVLKPDKKDPGVFRVQIQCFSENLQPGTTIPVDNPDMVFRFALGSDELATAGTFDRTASGWRYVSGR